MDTGNPMEPPQRAPLALVPDAIDQSRSEESTVDTASLVAPNRPCSARSKQTGEPCRVPAIPGGSVCRFHGGKSPQVQAAALARIRQARDLALEKLAAALEAQGEFLDPRTLLDITVKLTDKVELLEGRATERKESTTTHIAEVRAKVDHLLDELEERRNVREQVLP